MQEHHLRVRRTARYHTIGGSPGSATTGHAAPPARAQAGTPAEAWFVCHGYRQLARYFLRRFEPIAGPDRLVVAPEGLSRFYLDDDGGAHGPEHRVGATWMTREDRLHEIADYVEYMDALHRRVLADGFADADADARPVPGASRVVALGFSQGAATAARWAALGTARIDRLILWAGGLPPDLDLDTHAARLRTLRVTLVAGEADPYAGPEAAEQSADRLRAAGVPCEIVTFDGGHRVEETPLLRVAETGAQARTAD